MSEDELNKILNEMHKNFGVCGHCGRWDCGGKSTNSKLPDKIDTEVMLEILNANIK
jgi:hypothetical protein